MPARSQTNHCRITTIIGPPGRHAIMPKHRPVKLAWDYVMMAYFPEWTASHFWSVRIVEGAQFRRWSGFCRPAHHIIDVNARSVREGHAYLCAVLIHEICYAMTVPGHGMQWNLLMKEMAWNARDMADDEIARLLEQDATLSICRWSDYTSVFIDQSSASDE